MKRALMVTSATAVGLFAALSYTPRMALPAVSAAPATPIPATSAPPVAAAPAPAATTAAAAATAPGSTAAPAAPAATGPAAAPAAPTSPAAVSGTFHRNICQHPLWRRASRRHRDGREAHRRDGAGAGVPSADTKSAAISASAVPDLREETIAAQSAEVATISGATYTSQAWQESAAAALARRGCES